MAIGITIAVPCCTRFPDHWRGDVYGLLKGTGVMIHGKDKILKAFEIVLTTLLDNHPEATDDQKKNVQKVIHSFINLCGRNFSATEILNTMTPVDQAMKLFKEYADLQLGNRTVH